MDNDGVMELAAAIVEKAVKDYRQALRRLRRIQRKTLKSKTEIEDERKAKQDIEEIERFLSSQMGSMLTDYAPIILRKLKKEKEVAI